MAQQGVYANSHEQFMQYMTAEYTPSPAASRGTAFHKLLEYGTEGYVKEIQEKTKKGATVKRTAAVVYERDLKTTWVFGEQVIEIVNEYRRQHPAIVHEVWQDAHYRVRGHDILMRMKLDGLEYLKIREAKTSSRQKQYTDYWPSMQWKCELAAMPDAEAVVYDIFQLNTKNDKCNHYSLTYNRPPDVVEQVEAGLHALILYLENTGNIHLIHQDVWEAKRR